jgi:hypothetical protein
MNTNHLVRQYDKLSAPERLALLLAATARGDEVERVRLLETAPRLALSVPHQFGLTESFLLLSQLQFMELLDVAGSYLAALAATGERRRRETEAAWEAVLLTGYQFNTYLAGWRQFCAGFHLEPLTMWGIWPGYPTIQRVERLAGRDSQTGLVGAAYAEEGVARYLAAKDLGDAAASEESAWQKYQPLTAAHRVAELRAAWEFLRKRWE